MIIIIINFCINIISLFAINGIITVLIIIFITLLSL